MAPTRRELMSEKPNFNFIPKKPRALKKKVFNPIEDWKADRKFKVIPRVVSVDEKDLNKEQLSILNLVKKQCLLSDREFFSNPLRLIVSGPAGTGKSIVIQHILLYLEEEKKRRENFEYWAVAPTAVAASTIQGQTIHSRFGLTKFSGNLWELTKKMDKVGVEPNDVHFLIIDEMSMLGRSLFNFMDQYFRHSDEAFNSIPFGGRSVILCGDHWQLKPVRDSALFEPPPLLADYQVRQALEIYRGFNTIKILTIQNRQVGSDQEEFRNFLQRISRRQATSSDVELLNSRRLEIQSQQQQELFDEAIHVYGKNSGVYKRNL